MTVTSVLAGYAALATVVAVLLGLRLARRSAPPGAGVPPAGGFAGGGPNGRPVAPPPNGPTVGSPAPYVFAPTVAGRNVDSEQLFGAAYLVAFFSSTCLACRSGLPGFVRYAGGFPGAARRVLAVVVGDQRRGEDIVAALDGAATVVSEPSPGSLALAYHIRLFPSFVLVDAQGTVTAVENSVHDLPGAVVPT